MNSLRPFAVLILLCAGSQLCGCATDLYVTESEAAAFAANLRTSQRATDLFDDLDGKVIDIHIATMPGSGFRVQSSNTLVILREIQNLVFLDDAWNQIELQRLASQLDAQLGNWLAGQTTLLERAGGSRVRVTRIDRVTLGIVEPPTFIYDAQQQTIEFELKVSSGVHGRLYHRLYEDDLGGAILGFFANLFSGSGTAEGENDMSIHVNDLPVRGRLRLSQPFQDAAAVVMELDLQVEQAVVSVVGSGPSDIRDAARSVIIENMKPTIRETHSLLFRYFAINHLSLSNDTAGVAQLTHGYRSRIEPAVADVDIVARGNDGRLYHSQRRRGEFAPESAIELTARFDGDPVLLASAPDRLDLFGVARDGDLVYAVRDAMHWREAWKASDDGALDRYDDQSRVAAVATGVGQFDVVAAGADGWLYHLRRVNGTWQPPAGIVELNTRAGTRLRDPVLVQVGYKLLLVARDANRRLFGAVYDLEARLWSQPTELGTDLAYAPAAVLLDDWRVGIAYNTRDGHLRYRAASVQAGMFQPNVGTSGLSYWGEVIVGSGMDGAPVFASTGYNSAQLAVRGDDAKLHVNHLLGGGWQGWITAGNSLFGTPSNGNVGADMTLVSTGYGQLVWAGKRGNGRSRVLYNQHPGYATSHSGPPFSDPTHWRGLEDVSNTRFVGRPAIVVNGRAAALAVVDREFYPSVAVAGDDFPSTFVRAPTPVTFGPDPVLVQPHHGGIDLLYVGDDGHAKHVSQRFGLPPGTIRNLPNQPGSAGTLAAVAAANQVDAVVLSSDQSLYYSRFRAGQWSGPVGFASGIISAPAVVDTGAGQLEIFAISKTQALVRWRLVNGQLGSNESIQLPFEPSAVLFGPGSAAASGDGRVDVVVAEAQTGRLHHTRFEPGRTGVVSPSPSPLTGPYLDTGLRTSDLPVLKSIGTDRLQLIVVDGGQIITSRFAVPPPRPAATATLPANIPGGGPTVHETVNVTVSSTSPVNLLTANRPYWGPPTPVHEGPALPASGAVLAESELLIPYSDATSDLSMTRFRDGMWLPSEPVFGELPPLPDNRPSRLVAVGL